VEAIQKFSDKFKYLQAFPLGRGGDNCGVRRTLRV